MINKNNNIGRMLKTKREQLELSQQEVANYVNVSKSAVSRWESGEISNMGISRVKSLSEILKIDPIEIVLGETMNQEEIPTSEIIDWVETNKKKLSSISKEDSKKLIKLIDIYLD